MVVKFAGAFSSSGHILYSFGLPSRKALSLINLVLNVLNNVVSQKHPQGLLSVQGTRSSSPSSRQGTQERKAQTEVKLYLSLILA